LVGTRHLSAFAAGFSDKKRLSLQYADDDFYKQRRRRQAVGQPMRQLSPTPQAGDDMTLMPATHGRTSCSVLSLILTQHERATSAEQSSPTV